MSKIWAHTLYASYLNTELLKCRQFQLQLQFSITIFVTKRLKILRFPSLKEVFVAEIHKNVDVNYCKNNKLTIFS